MANLPVKDASGTTVYLSETGSGTNPDPYVPNVTAGGVKASVSANFTRPADTTAYAAGDAVSNSTIATTALTLTGAAKKSGGTGYIVGVRLSTNLKSITPRFRVHFLNANNPTMSSDNAAFQMKYADESKRIGSVDLPAMTTPADTTNSDMSRSFDQTVRVPFVAVGSADIYAILEALDAFTPASGQGFTLTIQTEQD